MARLAAVFCLASLVSISAGVAALATATAVTVQPPVISETANLYVRTGGPYLRDAYGLGVDARDIAIAGNIAYVAAGADGFATVALQDGEARILARLRLDKLALRVTLDGDTAWVLGSTGLYAIDVHDPAAPRMVGHYATSSAPLGLAVADGRGYLLLEREFHVLDLQRREDPRVQARVRLRANGRSIAASGDRVFIAAGQAGLMTFDVRNPGNPVETARLRAGAAVSDVAISSDRLYIAAGAAGVTAFQLAAAAPPRWLGSLYVGRPFDRLSVDGGQALAQSSDGDLFLLDVANPDAMNVAARVADGCCAVFHLFGREARALADGSLFVFDLSPGRPRMGNEGLAFGQGVNLGGQRRIAIDGDTAYVADWFSGLHIYDIGRPGYPALLATLHTGGSSKGVTVRDGYAYVADDDHGVQIIDIHDRRHPKRISGVDTPGLAYTPVLEGNWLFLAAHHGGLAVIDISDPRAPVLASRLDLPGRAWSLRIRNDVALVADDDAGVVAIDVRDPRAPRLIGQFNPGGHAEDIALKGNMAFVAFFEGDVRVLDISRPSAPVEIARFDTPGNARGLAIDGGKLLIADWLAGIQVADVRDPVHPAITGGYDTDGAAWGVAVSGHYAMVADWWGGISMLDIRDGQTPGLAGVYPRRDPIERIAVDGQYAYVAQDNGGLQVFDIQNPLNPTWVTGIDMPAVRDPVIIGKRLFAARESGRIAIIDVSDPIQARVTGELRLDHPIHMLRGDGAHLLAIGRRKFTVIDPASGKRWRQELASDAVDAWIDQGQIFIATRGGNLETMTIGEDGLGEGVIYPAGGEISHVRAAGDRVILRVAGEHIRLLSRGPRLQEIGRIPFDRLINDIEIAGNRLYVASGRELVTYDLSAAPRVRLESVVEMLDRIASVTVSNDALYLAGARMPIAIDPPPDFVLARDAGGAVTVTVPSTAPPGAYDLAAEIPGPPAGTAILMRAAINVAPPHFGKPARAQ